MKRRSIIGLAPPTAIATARARCSARCRGTATRCPTRLYFEHSADEASGATPRPARAEATASPAPAPAWLTANAVSLSAYAKVTNVNFRAGPLCRHGDGQRTLLSDPNCRIPRHAPTLLPPAALSRRLCCSAWLCRRVRQRPAGLAGLADADQPRRTPTACGSATPATTWCMRRCGSTTGRRRTSRQARAVARPGRQPADAGTGGRVTAS